jgi:hypothetical protein
MRGDLLYRCRRCGRVFAAHNVADLDWMLAQLAIEAPMPEDWRTAWPDVRTIHPCKGDGRGRYRYANPRPYPPRHGPGRRGPGSRPVPWAN